MAVKSRTGIDIYLQIRKKKKKDSGGTAWSLKLFLFIRSQPQLCRMLVLSFPEVLTLSALTCVVTDFVSSISKPYDL